MAADVNFVWNYCNELSSKVWTRERRFMSGFDFNPYTRGASKEGLRIGSAVFQEVSEEFAKKRRAAKRVKLRWRVSNRRRANYSLGWIPFKARSLTYRGGQVAFQGLKLSLWDSYGLAGYELGAGSLSEDSRGRWYLNVTVKVKRQARSTADETSGEALGIDLGLKSHMADSAGAAVEAQQFYRDLEPAIATAQRANKKDRVRALHAKVSNRRKDFLHKLSTRQVRDNAALFVGDVDASALTQTRMAKSVLDAGWSAYRTMLQYKSDDAGVWFKVVDEKFSTQDCSACGARTGPKGRDGLSVRRWVCSCCGIEHDRDTNAACNIRRKGLAWLESAFAKAAEARADDTALNESAGPNPSALAPGHGRPDVGISVL